MKKESPIAYEDLSPSIRDGCEEGVWCTSCGKWAKKYRRAMGASIAKFLIDLYRAQQNHDRHWKTRELYPRDNKASTEGVLARHWGLIDIIEETNKAGAPVGSYKLTEKGRRFIHVLEYVPSHVYLYNGQCLGLDGKLMSIREALGKKFDYDELMRGV